MTIQGEGAWLPSPSCPPDPLDRRGARGDPGAALRRRRAGVAGVGRAPLRGARGDRRRLLPVARRRASQGAQAVARDRARDGQLRRRRPLLHDRAPAAGRRHPLPVARRRALPRPLPVLLRRAAAARPLPRRAAAVDAVGRRPDRRARLRRRRLRARLRPRARRHRRRPADGRHQPRLSDERHPAARPRRRPARRLRAPRLARVVGGHLRLRAARGGGHDLPVARRQRHATRSAACSTPPGPPAWSSSARRRGSARAGSTRGPWPTAASSPSR